MHMQVDMLQNDNILYFHNHALFSDNSITRVHVAGVEGTAGYREGATANALFKNPWHAFTQISCTEIIVSDHGNRCLRMIDRIAETTSEFSGTCGSDTSAFDHPTKMILDKTDTRRILVIEKFLGSVKAIDIDSRHVSIFAQSDFSYFHCLIQDINNGNIYVCSAHNLYQISHDGEFVRVTGSVRGFSDSTLHQSQFEAIMDAILIMPRTFLVADRNNHKLRLVDVDADEVKAFNACPDVEPECSPNSLLMTKDSLYVSSQVSPIRKITS